MQYIIAGFEFSLDLELSLIPAMTHLETTDESSYVLPHTLPHIGATVQITWVQNEVDEVVWCCGSYKFNFVP